MNVLDVDNDDLLKRLCEEYPSVIRLLKIMGVDLDDIEDLASDIFIDAYRNIGKLKDVDKLEAVAAHDNRQQSQEVLPSEDEAQ